MGRIDDSEKQAEDIIKELEALDSAAPAPLSSKPIAEMESTSEESATEPVMAEAPPAPPAVDPKEKQLQAALKGMSEAQRVAAEERKAREALTTKQSEIEAQLKELIEAQKKVKNSAPSEEDLKLQKLVEEFQEVDQISLWRAKQVAAELRADMESLKKQNDEWLRSQKEIAASREAAMVWGEVQKIHPDAIEVAKSDEMRLWIDTEAPPIYKQIYNGDVKGTAKDYAQVISHFKSTLAPTQITADKPTDKSTQIRSQTQPTSKPSSVKPLSDEELRYFRLNVHTMDEATIAKYMERLEASP